MARAKNKRDDDNNGGRGTVNTAMFIKISVAILAIAVFITAVQMGINRLSKVPFPLAMRGADNLGSASASTTSNNRKLQFEHWPELAKVENMAPVALVKHIESVGGYALQALEPIPANQSLVVVRSHAYQSSESVLQVEELGPLLKELDEEFRATLDSGKAEESYKVNPEVREAVERGVGLVRVVAWLLFEKQKGEESFWYSWIAKVLPAKILCENGWDHKVARNCLAPHRQQQWEQTMGEMGFVIKSLRRGCEKSKKLAQLLGSAFDKMDSLDTVQWAVSIVQSRAWLRPAPEYYTLVPLVDLTDPRASITRGGTSSEPVSSIHHRAQARIAAFNQKGPNSVVVFGDKEGASASSSSVVLVTMTNVAKGEYIWVHPPGGIMTTSTTLRRFGFADAQPHVINSYVNAHTLPKQTGGADESVSVPEICNTGNMLFHADTGKPITSLRKCLVEFFGGGSGDALEVTSDDEKKLQLPAAAKKWLLEHTNTVLERIHPASLHVKCHKYAQEKNSHGAFLISQFEATTRNAFLKLKEFVEKDEEEI